ncbi:MAG: glycogen debranching protein GlgX [Bryobacteraceae bacterium]|nr:glycogen debranching protein GlgX [Bryobacteraceae bacterium]
MTESRIDYYPTHEHSGFKYRRGHTLPFGAHIVSSGVNFSVFSSSATSCTLVLFRKHEAEPVVEIEFPQEFRIGDVYSMIVFDLETEELEYGYRFDGPWNPASGLRFDRNKVVCDPYAKVIGGRDIWREAPDWNHAHQHRGRLAFDDFDWEYDRPLEVPTEDLVLYEAHVRGFTADPSSGVSAPGTFAGLREKIPYLKELGINAIELLPIFEFDEWENSRKHPETGEWLLNYWGYSTLGFFAPKAGYAATGRFGMQVDELKTLVKELHKAGIEVILDVVFNHTAEGDHRGPTISFRGIDDRTYYILTPEGYYYNFSGCGNTLNCNHPVVRNMVLDCLRYWAAEYHIDGFRFDLASILGRDQNGAPLSNPPLLESLAYDPVLSKCKLIAEAWDAGGLYQVGSFPAYGRWAEWNGKYRDSARKFLKGEPGLVGEISTRIQGSPDLYYYRGPQASVNFITCHDGFTLRDLFSYNNKHNEANGENNNDGGNDNESWNCGWEGETDDPGVNQMRRRLAKNAICLLMLSRGIPMLLMGDEIGHTQSGNNNAYCHDDELGWLDWSGVSKNREMLRFTAGMIHFRREHPVLRGRKFFEHRDTAGSGFPDISFHGTHAWQPDFSGGSRCIAFRLDGAHAKAPDQSIYVAMNMFWDGLPCSLPGPGEGKVWKVVVNTSMPGPDDFYSAADAPVLHDQHNVIVGPRSILVLIADQK